MRIPKPRWPKVSPNQQQITFFKITWNCRKSMILQHYEMGIYHYFIISDLYTVPCFFKSTQLNHVTIQKVSDFSRNRLYYSIQVWFLTLHSNHSSSIVSWRMIHSVLSVEIFRFTESNCNSIKNIYLLDRILCFSMVLKVHWFIDNGMMNPKIKEFLKNIND